MWDVPQRASRRLPAQFRCPTAAAVHGHCNPTPMAERGPVYGRIRRTMTCLAVRTDELSTRMAPPSRNRGNVAEPPRPEQRQEPRQEQRQEQRTEPRLEP